LALIEALAKIAQAVGEINTNYDPDSLLDALKTVDGAGSGLDADMVDGLHADEFLPSAGVTLAPNEAFVVRDAAARPLFAVRGDGDVVAYNKFRVARRERVDNGKPLYDDIFSARNSGVRYNKNLPIRGDVFYDREFSSRTVVARYISSQVVIVSLPALAIVRVSLIATAMKDCYYFSEYICHRGGVLQGRWTTSNCFDDTCQYPSVFLDDNDLSFKWLDAPEGYSIRVRAVLY
jgi:hypothetical protein